MQPARAESTAKHFYNLGEQIRNNILLITKYRKQYKKEIWILQVG